ncbi:hypothetical protein GHK58_33290 [Sinorhizobium meliloti]|uniref:hypothetical protein n=1 Tax=Rhizobium meliloti TaxID=382 RepID=UPI0012976EBA|nr:hypothetical protein [Sinorhizobium meliloti]MQX44879.1 hypothetical protein [Sinorhizobium meliloti]
MNRKEFVQSHGADCKNWNWSWSFVNHSERFVIFGVWQSEQENRLGCILRKNWEISAKGRKNNGYGQALEHIPISGSTVTSQHRGFRRSLIPGPCKSGWVHEKWVRLYAG